jgi:hypothetical protein
MNILYWSVANLIYSSSGMEMNKDFYTINKIASIFCIFAIICYSLMRFYFNSIGGLYMIKKILIAAILAPSYDAKQCLSILIAV